VLVPSPVTLLDSALILIIPSMESSLCDEQNMLVTQALERNHSIGGHEFPAATLNTSLGLSSLELAFWYPSTFEGMGRTHVPTSVGLVSWPGL